MPRFIVVPKLHGRATTYEVIDTDAGKPYRFRLGHLDCEHTAETVAEILNEHRSDYTAKLAAKDQAAAF